MPVNRPAFSVSCCATMLCGVLISGQAFGTSSVGVLQHTAIETTGWTTPFDACTSVPNAPWSIARPSMDPSSAFMAAIDRVAAKSDHPQQKRRSLLLAMRTSNLCYAPDLSPEEFERLIAASGLLPASNLGPQHRFNLSGTVWTGDGQQGGNGQALRARLTYSFPADGVTWGTSSSFVSLPNSLNSVLTTNFVFQDIGREWIRQGLATWKRVAGITYDEVADNGIAMDTVTTRRNTVGDIRIGGHPFLQTDGGTDLAGVLAYNNFPGSGGDMVFDTTEFTASRFLDSDDNYRYFRNVTAHEHGHGLGFIHQVPCDATKLMEPLVSTAYDVLQVDDRRGAGSAYGDRHAGNISVATAFNLGTFGSLQEARFEHDLSINGQNGPNGSGEDWFKFTITAQRTMFVSMAPSGGTYTTGAQSGATASMPCNGSSSSINASSAGDLDIQLYDTNGTTLLNQSTAGAGSSEFLSQLLNPGTYYIRVFDFGPNPGDKVQLYNLQVGIQAGLFNPYANAGINKRIGVGEFCQFMGDINSIAGILPINSYQWDLDGNGSVETLGARPITVYTTPGIRTVTLVIVDSVGHNALDSIRVTVIGSAPNPTSVSPLQFTAGVTTPFIVNGTFLGSPTVSISGTGVTITGTPSVDLANPSAPITGLSFVVDPSAPPGPRSLTVTTPSGTTVLNNAFFVVQPTTTFTSISPSTGLQGASVPVTINGANFNGSVSVAITSGSGVTISGTPVVNPARTQITGLTFNINGAAAAGPRTVQVTALGGTPTNTFTVTVPTPDNDLCANATALTLGGTANGLNVGAGTEGAVATGCASGTNSDVFYSFTPICTASYHFETAPNSFDTVLSVHSGCQASAANSLACNDDAVPGTILASRLDVNLTGGTPYIVRVASFGSRPTGAFTLTATPTTPLANDTCSTAANLPLGPTPFDTCVAVTENTGITSCAPIGNDLWYQFTADRAGRTTIDTCGSMFDTVLEVFTSACGTTTPAIVCEDDECGTRSRVAFTAAIGTTYRVRVGGYFGFGSQNFGTGTLTRYCPADVNLSGAVTVQDIFDFLAAYFANAPAGDFNGSGGVTVQDIFDFLAAYFAGCA